MPKEIKKEFRYFTELANYGGWRIPKDRFDLRMNEIVEDIEFWRAIKKVIKRI